METNLRLVATIILLLCTSATSADATKLQREAPASLYLTNIFFVSATQGWMLGSTSDTTYILYTKDGGETWTKQHETTVGLFDIKFVSDQVGWAVGSSGTVLHTSDSGVTWERQVSGTTALLAGLATINTNTAWIAGANGTMLFTENGGKTWTACKVNTNVSLSDISFADARHGIAVGYGVILLSNDGGKTWETKSSGEWRQLSSVLIVNECKGWITVGPIILRTTDGSKTLHESIPPSQGQVTGLSFVDAQRGWVAKSRGEEGDTAHIRKSGKLSSESFILSTSDGGISWQEQLHIKSEKDHDAWVTSIFFIDQSRGWVVGRNNLIYKTVDGGKKWNKTGTVVQLR
ncbi:MAG TPA: YCF48-related protein [Pyrinomonadaceae bacterium]